MNKMNEAKATNSVSRQLTVDVRDVGEQRQRYRVTDKIVVGQQEKPGHHRQASKGVFPLQQILVRTRTSTHIRKCS